MRRHTGAIVAVLLIGVTLQHSTPFVEAADAPAVSPVPKFATQRWGQALHHMASMVGVAWGNERLVSPPGDLTMSNMWPVKVGTRSAPYFHVRAQWDGRWWVLIVPAAIHPTRRMQHNCC